MPRPTLRLYILGNLTDGTAKDTLTTLAEFKDSRGLERVEVDKDRVEELAQSIRDLEAFLINGRPSFKDDQLSKLGSELFKLLFTGRVKKLFERAVPKDEVDELRPLEIIVEDKTIAGWPWEYAFDAEDEKFLCQDFYPISRGIFNLFPRDEPPARPDAVRILFVFGASRADKDSSLAEQMNKVKFAFKRNGFEDTDTIAMDVMEAADPFDLQSRLQEKTIRYDILHFYGHAGFDAAKDEGYLVFDTSDALTTGAGVAQGPGDPKKRLYANLLSHLLVGKKIRLAFLNACETATSAPGVSPTRSSVAATLLSKGVPAVIATQFVMPDNSAHYFAASVYKSLVQGGSLIEAMRAGRVAMEFDKDHTHPDWGIPVLYASYPELKIFQGAPQGG